MISELIPVKSCLLYSGRPTPRCVGNDDRQGVGNRWAVAGKRVAQTECVVPGHTSMEVAVNVEVEVLEAEQGPQHALSAYFTMVALDRNGRPMAVPPLELETEEAKAAFEAARKRARTAASELNVMQLAGLINTEVDLLAAYPLGLIGIIFHHLLSLNIDKHQKFVHFPKSIIQDIKKLASMQKVIYLVCI